MQRQELWYFLIQGQTNNETGVFGNFYSYGNHLGDALDKVIEASKAYEFSNHNLTEAACPGDFKKIENNTDLVEIGTNIYMRPRLHTYPLDNTDKEFVSPTGIVKSSYEGEYKYELIKENFVAYGADENGIFVFELVLTKENLIDTFIKTIDFLPSVDGFWIYIKSFWENDLTELWVCKDFTDPGTIKEFLLKYKSDTLENGYIDIVANSLHGETNLTLDDHKKIQLHTKEESVFQNFLGDILDLGYRQTREFYNLEFGYHHFHYRPGNSLTREDFKQMLVENKFDFIDKWEE